MENQRLTSEESRTTSDASQNNNSTSHNSTTLRSTTPNNPTNNAVATSNNNSPSRNNAGLIQNNHPSSTTSVPSSNHPNNSDSGSSDSAQFTTRRFQNRNVLDNLSISTDENEFQDSQSVHNNNTPPSNVSIIASVDATTSPQLNNDTNTNATNDRGVNTGRFSEAAINILTQAESTNQSIDNDEDIDNGGDKDDPSPTGNSNNSRLSTLSSFVNCADGEIICLSILQSAKIKGCGEILYYGGRVNWFTIMISQWVLSGGISHGHRTPHAKTLCKKFKDAERLAKTMMERRQHQRDSFGNRDESRPFVFVSFY